MLLVHGEQGSAKSTLVRILRLLLDPNEAPVRGQPREPSDLIIAARNSAVIAFDNVSSLSAEMSDDLARVATGAGFGARQLYTDTDEVIVEVSRPIVLNGIEEVAVRGDLLDRGLILNLPTIRTYRDEDAFWRSFENSHPQILGALLNAVSVALANHAATAAPNVRMADFARWVAAAEPALGLEPDAFINAYRKNRAGAVQLTLESSVLSQSIIDLAAIGFEGKATELLATLDTRVGDEVKRNKDWPKRPHTLSGRLRRLAPALRRIGIVITFSRDSAARTISISTVDEESVTSVTDREDATRAPNQDRCRASRGGDRALLLESLLRVGAGRGVAWLGTAPTDFKLRQPCLQLAASRANPLRERVVLFGAKLLELPYHLMTSLEEPPESAAFVHVV